MRVTVEKHRRLLTLWDGDLPVLTAAIALGRAPELINQSAEKDGWLCTLGSFDAAELDGLMTADQYAAWCKK